MIENLPKHFIISFFGKPGSGKSHAIKYFLSYLYKNKLAHVVIVFTNTANNGFYQEFVDPKYVTVYKEKVLQGVWERTKGLNKHVLLVFDDILGSINFGSPVWNEIAANHRHNNVSILIASQSMTKLPVYVRDYSNFAVIFYQTTVYARRNAYNNFCEDYGTQQEFINFMNLLPKYKHAFILVDTTAAERDKKYKIMRCPEQISKFYYKNMI